MNTHPTPAAMTTAAPVREAAHPLTVAGPARRRWMLASVASLVLSGSVAPLLWVIGAASPANVLLATAGALITAAGLTMLGRWLRWAAWAQVTGAHARGVMRQDKPRAAVLFTLARIVAVAVGGVLIVQFVSTPGTVRYLGLVGGVLAGTGLVVALHNRVGHRGTPARDVVLSLVEATIPMVWVLGTVGMAWATLWFLLAASFTAVLILVRALVGAVENRVERWWERRTAERRPA